MGDRGNIAIIQSGNDQVWIYSHWGGHGLFDVLKQGLQAGKGRWQDESYLAKIIIGAVVPADNWKEETGYGISCRMQDNEHPILVVNINRQCVFVIPESGLDNQGKVPAGFNASKEWHFSEFVKLGKDPR